MDFRTDNNYLINIFVPNDILVRSRHVLFGIVQMFTNYALVNCVGSLSCDQSDFVEKTAKLCNQSVIGFGASECEVSVIGFISDASQKKRSAKILDEIKLFSKDICFSLYADMENDKLCVEKVHLKRQTHNAKQIRIIRYKPRAVMSSCLILSAEKVSKNLGTVKRMTFCRFLRVTTTVAVHLSPEMSSLKPTQSSLPPIIVQVLNYLCSFFVRGIVSLALKFECVYIFSSVRVPDFVSNIMQLSSVGRHLQRRLHHVHQITSSIVNEKEHLPLSCGNIISAIVFDVICGWIFTYLFWQCCSPYYLLQIALEYTNIIVNELQLILHWLMGVPAGLKLNVPLNTALGHFFLYHIYLWKTYMAIIKPIFAYFLEGVAILGALGLTFIICLLSDLLSIATIHIYCFYGYAAKLYGYQVAGLSALWRLFRGKKWNPLRQRIDSYTYSVEQLYIGTLFFTVLTFLLPTVMAYYVVFTVLRLMVLTILGIISRTVNLLSIFPVYAILLRIFNSSLTTGDVYFSVLQEQKVLLLNMEFVQIPLQSVIKRTLPKDVFKEEPMSWESLLDSLIWGKIIYPI